MTEDWRALNRANWDERVAAHLAPGGYDLASLRAGTRRLDRIVEAELAPVAGLRVLHLQCHFGLDSLTLAQRGADVTGLDFSAAAIHAARRLAAEAGLPTRFVQADLYDALEALPEPGSFDLVFVTWGTVCWLPDIATWAHIIAAFLNRRRTLLRRTAPGGGRVRRCRRPRWPARVLDPVFRPAILHLR